MLRARDTSFEQHLSRLSSESGCATDSDSRINDRDSGARFSLKLGGLLSCGEVERERGSQIEFSSEAQD